MAADGGGGGLQHKASWLNSINNACDIHPQHSTNTRTRTHDIPLSSFHHCSAAHTQQSSSPLAQEMVCPLTSAPLGHNNQRRRAEQRSLAPRDPASAPPGRGRHPAGDGPDGVYHDAERRDGERSGDIIPGILHPRCIRSFLLPLPASLSKCVTSPRAFKGASVYRAPTSSPVTLAASSAPVVTSLNQKFP